MSTASDGIVWVGSHAAGLDRFDSATGTAINFRNRPGDPRDIGDDHVIDVIVDNRGDTWAATRSAGLAHIDRQTLEVTRFHRTAGAPNRIPDDEIVSIFADSKGRIWAGTYSGLIFAEDVNSGFKLAELIPFVIPLISETSDGTLILEATLIAVPGGTNALPEGTWLVKKNRARGAWRSKGYLPPCSGGKRNTYSADVIAVTIDPTSKEVQEELAETTIRLGKY